MKNNKLELNLPSVDDLFSTQEMRDEAKLEKVMHIPVDELQPFKNHPFQIREDEEMERMVESARQFGILTPGLARPLAGGGYELISGHRRLAACRVLGIEAMPVIVRDMTDDESVIAMVDANLQREHILPSERAFAYKMKLEAINHQGKTSVQLGQKSSREIVAADAKESQIQIQRYIRLTHLLPELLQMVDDDKIAFTPAVELSYLTEQEQQNLLETIVSEACTPSLSQAQRLKKLSQEGDLTMDAIFAVMRESKANQAEKLSFKTEDLRAFFPKSYSTQQMQEVIMRLLKQWKERQRDRDSR